MAKRFKQLINSNLGKNYPLRLSKIDKQEYNKYSSFQLRKTKHSYRTYGKGKLSRKIFCCFYGFYTFIESSKDTIHLVENLLQASSWFKVR
jgi:hypothetical protein